jgi:dynein heavy chain
VYNEYQNLDKSFFLIFFPNRLAFHEFINNEDVRRLFVYIKPPRQIIASLQPAQDLKTKSVFFLKNNVGVKLTKDNMGM